MTLLKTKLDGFCLAGNTRPQDKPPADGCAAVIATAASGIWWKMRSRNKLIF